MQRSLFAVTSSLLAGLAVFAACASTTTARKAPALKQLKAGTLMGEMAAAIRDAEGILQSDASLTPGDHEKVAALLASVEASAKKLDPAAPAFAHPAISDHLPELRRAAEAAARDAMLQPPKYDEFGKLTAVCNACHSAPL